MSAGGCTLKVNLAGQGVSPTLRLDVPSATAPPPDPKKPAPPPSEEPFADKRVRLGGGKKSSMCFMGNLLSGDEITSTVIVENTSEFCTCGIIWSAWQRAIRMMGRSRRLTSHRARRRLPAVSPCR